MIMIIITIIVKPPAALQFLTLGFQEGLLKIQNKCNKLTNKTNQKIKTIQNMKKLWNGY